MISALKTQSRYDANLIVTGGTENSYHDANFDVNGGVAPAVTIFNFQCLHVWEGI